MTEPCPRCGGVDRHDADCDWAPDVGPSEQLELPGVVPQLVAGESAMVDAAKRTLHRLESMGNLTERHAVQVQLVLSLAAAIDAGSRSGRASAVAMAAKELRETMLVLDPPPTDPAEGAAAEQRLAELFVKLEAAANGKRVEP